MKQRDKRRAVRLGAVRPSVVQSGVVRLAAVLLCVALLGAALAGCAQQPADPADGAPGASDSLGAAGDHDGASGAAGGDNAASDGGGTDPAKNSGGAGDGGNSTNGTAGDSAAAGGTEKPAATGVNVRLGALKGPTTMGMVKLLADAEAGLTANDYTFTLAAAADELTPQLIQGQLDLLAVPANLAAVLYARTEGAVQLLAVNTLGVLYLVEKGGETVHTLADLAGKTIYATGKGNTPEYTLAYLLAQAGLTLGEDVQVEWKSEPTEVVTQMAADEAAVAMLPQPFVTVAATQLEGLRVALDLTQEWAALEGDSALVTGVLVARRAFVEEHPDAVAAFLQEYAASTAYVNDDPAGAATLIEGYGIVKAAIAQKAIPACNIVCLTGQAMRDAVSGYLQILYDQNPNAVGGSLPNDDFYWIGET